MKRRIDRRTFIKVSAGISAATLAEGGPLGGGAPARADTAPAPVRIRVTETQIAPPIPREVVGANHRWVQDGLGMWDESSGEPVPLIVQLSEQTRLAVVRYPGGTVANLFDWKRAIGPQAQRGCQVGGGFVGAAQPYDSVYGPDEHMKYMAAIGAVAQIMVPATLESPQDAADWVEYMNAPQGTTWGDLRAQNGHPEPYGIQWWEVGNEPYGVNQRYWRSQDNATAVEQFAFGGTQRQTGQFVGTQCDHRPPAANSSGSANQSFLLWYPPAVPGSQVVYVAGTAWQQIGALSQAGPNDPVYVFDPPTGTIRFGDGTHGMIPPRGAVITADYDSGPHPGFVDYYQAMKAVDPSIQVMSSWAKPEFVQLMGADHPYDGLTPHLYLSPDLSQSAEQIYDQTMLGVDTVLQQITALEQALDQYGPKGRRPIIGASEYGTIPKNGASDPTPGYAGTLMNGLYFGMVAAGMMEHGAVFAVSSNLNAVSPSLGELFGGSPQYIDTARAHAIELLGEMVGASPVESSMQGNPTATGSGGYPALRVLAARGQGGTLRILVVNRDRTVDVGARIQVDGASGTVTARVLTVDGAGYTSLNTFDDQTQVTAKETSETVAAPDFGHVFPAHSATLLEIG